MAAAGAVASTGSEALTATPSENLPDTGVTSVVVTGSDFVPGETVQLQQCSDNPGNGLCVVLVDVVVEPDGTFSTSVDVSYDMRPYEPGTSLCDSPTPKGCYVSAQYTSGEDNGSELPFVPLTFAGHSTRPPVAVLNVTPDSGPSPLAVHVNGEGSYDPDFLGGLTDYTFDFGDGSPTQSGFSAGWPHTYALPGEYTVTLTVTDVDGDTGTETHQVSVGGPINIPPYAYIYESYAPTPVGVGDEVSFEFYGNDQEGPVTLELDFGDGSPPFLGDNNSGNVNHAYTQPGSYTPVLTVTDEANAVTVYQGLHAVEVVSNNTPPVAQNRSITMNEDGSRAITLQATDPNAGDTLTYSIVSGPAHGTLSGAPPAVTYTPALNYSGPDSFTFKANDGAADSNTATVSITVNPVNDRPVANGQSVTTDEDTNKAITLTATDVDSATLTYTIVNGPSHGTLTGSAQNRTYKPAANYHGPDSFTFRANDGTINSIAATVSITVNPVNDRPVANGQSVTTDEDTNKAITLTATDIDGGGGTLTYNVVNGPSHGSLLGTAPNLTYKPAANYNGPDSFTFRANDGEMNSTAATVSITVAAVNDAPVFSSGFTAFSPGFREGQNLTFVSARFNDVDQSPPAAYQATVSWGDGTSTVATIDHTESDGTIVPAFVVDIPGGHRYAHFGTYDITFTVSDGSILVSHLRYRIPIVDAPILVVVLNNNGRKNRLYPPGAKPVACGYDGNSLRQLSDLTGATISWGDGTAAQAVGVSSNVDGCGPDATFSVRASHTYTQVASSRTISVTVYSGGGSTDTDTATIQILPQN